MKIEFHFMYFSMFSIEVFMLLYHFENRNWNIYWDLKIHIWCELNNQLFTGIVSQPCHQQVLLLEPALWLPLKSVPSHVRGGGGRTAMRWRVERPGPSHEPAEAGRRPGKCWDSTTQTTPPTCNLSPLSLSLSLSLSLNLNISNSITGWIISFYLHPPPLTHIT